MRRSLFCVNPLTQAGSNAAQSDPAWPPHHGNRSSPIALIALIALITLITLISLPILITQIDRQKPPPNQKTRLLYPTPQLAVARPRDTSRRMIENCSTQNWHPPPSLASSAPTLWRWKYPVYAGPSVGLGRVLQTLFLLVQEIAVQASKARRAVPPISASPRRGHKTPNTSVSVPTETKCPSRPQSGPAPLGRSPSECRERLFFEPLFEPLFEGRHLSVALLKGLYTRGEAG